MLGSRIPRHRPRDPVSSLHLLKSSQDHQPPSASSPTPPHHLVSTTIVTLSRLSHQPLSRLSSVTPHRLDVPPHPRRFDVRPAALADLKDVCNLLEIRSRGGLPGSVTGHGPGRGAGQVRELNYPARPAPLVELLAKFLESSPEKQNSSALNKIHKPNNNQGQSTATAMEQHSTSEVEQSSLQEASVSSSSTSCPSPSPENLMKLLRGKTDSQRLAGLLLVTKLCDKNDQRTILDVYEALGSTFLHRLLLTGMGKGSGGWGDSATREAYLRLSVTVLAAFARVSQVAAMDEMLSKVPLILEVLSMEYVIYYVVSVASVGDFSLKSGSSVTDECYEFLFLVTAAHDDGVTTLYNSGGMNVLASQMPCLSNGSHAMELAMKLVQLMISKLSGEKVYVDHPSELSMMVAAIAKQFALLHNALKFEALHLLVAILSSNYSGALHAVLRSMECSDWLTCIRIGVIDVLQNRVAPADKFQALILVECVLSIVGEEWLIGPTTFLDARSSFPADRCILLVLETSRVEIAVVLNELAYLKYETSENSSRSAEAFKLRKLGIAFSLIEKIIKLLSNLESDESNIASLISESTSTKIITGLNETIGLVLDYLQDAKDHGVRKGDDLLASVRIVGRNMCEAVHSFRLSLYFCFSYLAEAPCACREKIKELLGYLLSVEEEDESSSSCSVTFLLPMLCQITMDDDGCKLFDSNGAFGAVVDCLISLIQSSRSGSENGGTIYLACDTILNFLLKREQLHFYLDNRTTAKLLLALPCWTESASDPSVIMMASSICSLVLGSTSEEFLLRHPEFNSDNLNALAKLIKRSLVTSSQDPMHDDSNSEAGQADLHQIVISGYSSWSDRFPLIKQAVEG
ncbi:neurochondrin family protein [Striga asiatica]|uniref:Neurochondrin family protein n=1 Tax=Striga asiatica TaxID=4170 RepID=A0A5A7R627_STRAF|nr:neurochondrin family protein [Striga asiatica]